MKQNMFLQHVVHIASILFRMFLDAGHSPLNEVLYPPMGLNLMFEPSVT